MLIFALVSVCSIFGYAAWQTITITWVVVNAYPNITLVDPSQGLTLNVNTTSFNWTTTDDGLQSELDHVWYVDVLDTFTSPFRRAVDVDDNQTYTNSEIFDDGKWFWRVEVSDGSLINISDTWNFTVLTNGSNNFPYLSGASLHPVDGTNMTTFFYNVTFFDPDNDSASFVNVTVNGSYEYTLSEVDAGDTDTSDGKNFSYSTTMIVGTHNYSFTCGDGDAVNATQVYVGPNVTGYSDFPPVQSNPSPVNNSINVEFPLSNFSISLSDQDGNLMDVYLLTNESSSWVLFNSSLGLSNGSYIFTNTSWVDDVDTVYYWSVNLSDGLYWSNVTYCFTSEGLLVYDEYPDNESFIGVLQPTLVFSIVNPLGLSMNYSLYLGNSSINCTSLVDNASLVGNGTYYYNNYYSANSYDTFYWRVYLNDSSHHANYTFHFTTIAGGGQVIGGGGSAFAIGACGLMIAVVALALVFMRRKE